jgi:hypothetical protein
MDRNAVEIIHKTLRERIAASEGIKREEITK